MTRVLVCVCDGLEEQEDSLFFGLRTADQTSRQGMDQGSKKCPINC
jgi:hypothetical protein